MKPRRFTYPIFLFALAAPFALAQKTIPVPTWKPGSISYYSIHLKTSRDIKTKSAVALPEVPNQDRTDVSGILQIEVLASDPAASYAGARLRTHFLYLVSDIGALQLGKKPDQLDLERSPANKNYVDFLLQPDGQVTQISGLDQLAAEQQDAWREWASHFSAAVLIETEGRKRGAKWSSEQQETSSSPIAELLWQKKSQYVHDEPCAPIKYNSANQPQRSTDTESCAAILTTASLVQKSAQQDATPQDYKLRGLRTRGAAKGTNETILYISRKTGQLIRATQDAKQRMDVQIALGDGASQVHYAVTASANSAIELVTELPFTPPKNP